MDQTTPAPDLAGELRSAAQRAEVMADILCETDAAHLAAGLAASLLSAADAAAESSTIDQEACRRALHGHAPSSEVTARTLDKYATFLGKVMRSESARSDDHHWPRVILEDLIEQWDKYGEDADDARFAAAHDLMGVCALGSYRAGYSVDEPNDDERYKSFEPIPLMVAQLVAALDDAEYEEYSTDQDGITARAARQVAAQARELADAVEAWGRGL